MKLLLLNFVIVFLLCFESVSNPSLSLSNNNNRFEIEWDSSVNQNYRVLTSSNLVFGFDSTNTVQATPPLNRWYSDTESDSLFFKLSPLSFTNIPNVEPITSNLLTNSYFN